MAKVTLNLKGVEGFSNFSVIPAGRYTVSIVKSVTGESRAGNPKLSLNFQVEEDLENGGKYIGRRIFHDIPIQDTDSSKGRIVDLLLALGYTAEMLNEEAFELDTAELVGMTAVADVVIRQLPGRDGLDKSDINDIKRFHNRAHVASTGGDVVTHGQLDLIESDVWAEKNNYEYFIPEDVKLSAKARELATKHQVSFTGLQGSGPGNTFTLADVQALVDAEAGNATF